jgi:hypothetical protein
LQKYYYIWDFKKINKILVKYLYITVFFILITYRIKAQNTDTPVFQSHSVRLTGFGFPVLNYPLISPLNHSGYSIGFHSVRFRDKGDCSVQFQINSEFGLLYNNANDSYITMLNFSGIRSKHRYITDRAQPFNLLLGVGSNIGINIFMKDDNTNNPMAYFFNLSINPNILLKYRFKINNSSFELMQQIDFSLLSLISSSGYSSSLPYGITENDASFFDAMRFASLGSLIKCETATILDISSSWQQRKRLPVFRITYTFSGMNYKKNDMSIKYANNMFLFGIIFYLFR